MRPTPTIHPRSEDPLNPPRGIGVALLGTAFIGAMFFGALSLCNDFYGVRAKIDQEHFSGYRTASTEQAR